MLRSPSTSPGPAGKILEFTALIQTQAPELFGKLLDNVQGEQREVAVRSRLLREHEELQKFATDHPRMFGLLSSEKVNSSPELQSQANKMIVMNLASRGAGGSQSMHDSFVHQTLAATTKGAPSS